MLNDGPQLDSGSVVLRLADISEPGVAALIATHHALMRSTSPAESCHVMEADALAATGAVLVAADLGETVVGIGAFTDIGAGHAELKSMHTSADARGHGVGRAILKDLMERARSTGFKRMSLETGSQPEFAAARALYEAQGFSYSAPFGSYVEDPLSVFMTLEF